MFSRSGLSFEPHVRAALLLARLDERAPDVTVLHEPVAVGDAATRTRSPARPGTPDSGTGITMSASHGRLARELLAHALARARARRGRRAACRDARCRRTRRGTASVAPRRSGCERTPLGVDRDHLAGLDVADEVRADDVERGRLAREHPAALGAGRARAGGSRARSRTPNRCASSISTSENAPASRGQHLLERDARGRGRRSAPRRAYSPASSSPIELAVGGRARRAACRGSPASSSVFVRLPLCPSEKPASATER